MLKAARECCQVLEPRSPITPGKQISASSHWGQSATLNIHAGDDRQDVHGGADNHEADRADRGDRRRRGGELLLLWREFPLFAKRR